MGRRTFLATAALTALSARAFSADDPIRTQGDVLGDRLEEDFNQNPFVHTFHTMPPFARGKFVPMPCRPLTDASFRWISGYVHATRCPNIPTLAPAGQAPAFSFLRHELAAYPNADAMTISGCSPFSIDKGNLIISADRTPAAVRAILPDEAPHDYFSGALSSYPYSQRYGYFELKARVPSGRGLWPAFWLLPADLKWPPEIDVMEVLCDNTRKLHTTLHSRLLTDTGNQQSYGTATVDLSDGFHAYGVDWGPDRVRFYLDRRLIFSRVTPGDWHSPFYLLINLAVGGAGSWPGPPDPLTRFPARFEIDSVSAYQRKTYLEAASAKNKP